LVAVYSLLVILVLSISITKIATVALTHTGLSRESARFQARSAFTGVGFTTREAEPVVNHPVRRRILMLLMLLGNVGIVSAISSLVLTFVQEEVSSLGWVLRIGLLTSGVAGLWSIASSQWLDTRVSRAVSWALNRWSELEVRDYAGLLHLSGDYKIVELEVAEGDWLAEKCLSDLCLRDEGVLVLGIQRDDGRYVGAPKGSSEVVPGDRLLLYGRESALKNLDERGELAGNAAHDEAVREQQKALEEQEEDERARKHRRETERVRRRPGGGDDGANQAAPGVQGR
jgi:hypothetical protein